ncbi:MaoC family dehydratase [Alteromonas gracilis]|uniref:MaoC family dehydratase n=1 Tax=Alteromonas gracilis TaxID=1479524 RepID=UPI003735E6C7
MFREYTKALFKRVDAKQLMQFKPPTLPQRIYTKTFNIDNAHYGAFCQEVDWPASENMHPLYLQMLSLPLQMQCLLDKQSPFPLLGLIHAGNSVVVLDNCDLSEPFECRVRFHEVRPHSRGWEVDVILEALQAGTLVYRAISSYLVKVKAVHVAPLGLKQEIHDECELQDRGLIGEISATANTGRRYAKLSGDYNPIHLSAISAKAFGFKKPIAHGMWTLSRAVSALVSHNDNAQSLTVKEVNCRFKKPVFLPNEIHIQQHCKTADSVLLDVTDSSDSIVHLSASVAFNQP